MWMIVREFWTPLFLCCLLCSALWGQCGAGVRQNQVDDIVCEPYASYALTELPVEDYICHNFVLFYSQPTLYSTKAEEHGLQATRKDGYRSGPEIASQMQSGQGIDNSSWPLENFLLKLLQRTLSCSKSGDFRNLKLLVNSQGSISSCGRHLFSHSGSGDDSKKVESELSRPVAKLRWPQVEITPCQVDLGQSDLYVPSGWALSVENACNLSDSNVFEPSITDTQLYTYDPGRALLGAGKSISMDFVYLPPSLGLSIAEFVMETSSGSLLIQAKDLEFESPYRMVPSVGFDIGSCGWSGSLSFAYPIRVPLRAGGKIFFAKALCREGNYLDLLIHRLSNVESCLGFFHSCPGQHSESYIGQCLPWLGINSARSVHRKMSPSSIKAFENVEGKEYLLLNLRNQGITSGFSMIDMNLLLLDISTQSSPLDSKDIIFAMGKPVVKELHLTNIGGLPIKVSRISISGTECELDGFYVHECKSFSLEPGESTVLQISYLPNLSSPSSLVKRDLELGIDSGTVMIPLKARVPRMLKCSWKSMSRLSMRKCYLAATLAVGFMMFVVFLFLPNDMDLCSLDDFIKGKDESSFSMGEAAKLSHSLPPGRSLKSPLEPDKMAIVDCGFHSSQSMDDWKQGSTSEQVSVLQNGMTSIPTPKGIDSTLASKCIQVKDLGHKKSLPVASISAKEELSSETADLTIRTRKQRRRRRKRKDPTSVGIMGSTEVASSNSGTSTPSSPISPLYDFTSRQPSSLDKEPKVLVVPYACEKNLEIQLGSRSCLLKTKVSVKDSDRSVPLLSSLEQPVSTMTCDILPAASTSKIPLHARAPGPKFQKRVQTTEQNPKAEDRFTYDIWGEHFSWIHLGPEPDKVSVMALGLSESDCNSFFLYGPQTRVPNSRKRYASYSNGRVNDK